MRRTKTRSSTSTLEPDARDRRSMRRQRVPAVVLVGVAVALVIGGFALGRAALSTTVGASEPIRKQAGSTRGGRAVPEPGSAIVSPASAGSRLVEVPQLVGMRVDEAVVVLETAGLKVALVDLGAPVSSPGDRVVHAQTPAQGTVLSADATVSLVAPPKSESDSPTVTVAAADVPARTVVCIDPGHQAHADTKLEPLGPGSKREKPRATGGATGVATGVPEYELALQISMNLKKRLEDAGFKVVMTRTTNDVRLSNSERAKIANRAHAALLVRIHGGASTNAGDSGIATFYPAKNRWTERIVSRSRSAAEIIEESVVRTTGANDRGTSSRTGMAGFNWSKCPAVLVEAGVLSNPLEDRLMASPSYQDKLASGMAEGIEAFLRAEGP